MPDKPRVAVIGGGYAGMAAAVELAHRGAAVTVFESAKVLGGRARRVEHEGLALDNGLHILIGAYRETLRMIERVNPQHERALLRLPLSWQVQNEFRLSAPRLPAPFHLLVALACARGVAMRERINAAGFMRRMRRSRYALERDISVERLLEDERQGSRITSLLWHPLCLAALNTPPAVASAQVFLNVLRDGLDASREASDLVLARTDLSALFPEPAAAFVEKLGGQVLRQHRVTAIDPIEDGFFVKSPGHDGHFSHVVCALPPQHVRAFVTGITELADIAEMIDQFHYQTICSIWLQYPQSVRLPAPMLAFSGGLVHWAFDREALCGQRGLIGAVISAHEKHQQLPHDELAQQVHQELARHLGDLSPPAWHQVITEKRATFSCEVGIRRPPQVTPLRHFYLAGDYTASDYPATLEAAVRSGIACARHILRQ